MKQNASAKNPQSSTLEYIGIAALLYLVALVVFAPGLRAWFVSDAWKFLEFAYDTTYADVFRQFLPEPENWYRPLTRLIFQIEFNLFGLEPLGYHLVALALHVASAFSLYGLTRLLLKSRLAALLAAFLFLLTIHAHEVVWSIGDLHNSLAGAFMLTTLWLYIAGKYKGAFLALALNLMADETGIVTCALLGLYEICLRVSHIERRALQNAAFRFAPFALLTATYLLFRVLWARSILNESVPCHAPLCLINGMSEYLNRLFVRHDQLLALLWTRRPYFTIVISLALIAFTITTKPWRWAEWRVLLFASGWMALASFFLVWSLWPYVADRFWYVPDMGLALALATVFVHVRRAFPTLNSWQRAFTFSAGVVLLLWIALGAIMLFQRGQLWQRAGEQAHFIVQNVQHLVPNPPPNPTFIFDSIPDSYLETFPPGNTGPYVFRNGLREALHLHYARADVDIAIAGSEDARTATNPIYLTIAPDRVELISRPPP